MKKTYIEKLNNTNNLPKIVTLDKKVQEKFGGKTMAIAKPIDIYNIIKNIKKGKLITTMQIRNMVSKQYNTDVTYPLTTGIFINICAFASIELNENIPYHRVLKTNGELNLKFPNAPEEQIALLEDEGYKIIKKGKKLKSSKIRLKSF